MNDVSDARLRTAFDDHRTHIHFDPQSFYRGQGTIDFLAPCVALAGDVSFLRRSQRRKQGQHANQADELWRVLQSEPPQFLYLEFLYHAVLSGIPFQSISGNCASMVRACDLMYWL